jgi:hypothetical protein
MLVLFDKDKTTQYIEDFLSSIDIERSTFASAEAYSPKTTIEIAKKVDEKGGIIIPAHIDEYNGLCEISYQSREDLYSLPYISAVQVVHKIFTTLNPTNEEIKENLTTYYNREISEDRFRDWKVSVNRALINKKAILTFSDNPAGPGESKHGLWGIGQRYTWLKMNQDVNLESLRQALLLPEHRVKNDFTSPTKPFIFPDSWIEKLKITNTELNSEEVEIDFSPQMSTIIGGRGTGKSSLLRFIRGIFGKINDLKGLANSNLIQDQTNFYKIKQNEEGILKNESIVEITVIRYGQKYNIITTDFNENGPQKITVLKWNEENKCYEDIRDDKSILVYLISRFSHKNRYLKLLKNQMH